MTSRITRRRMLPLCVLLLAGALALHHCRADDNNSAASGTAASGTAASGAPADGSAVAAPTVTVLHAPGGGIQPQAAVDDRGTLHVVYFKGTAAAGDLFYVQRAADVAEFSAPLRVNSQRGSAIATGTIRGAQIALGKDDSVHIAWNGSDKADKGVGGNPMLYTHLDTAGTAFEPQRNLITWAGGLDGGGSLAADKAGNVYVAWHAMADANDEAGRAVFVARSRDNGAAFGRESRASMPNSGACGCCQMRAFADRDGTLYLLYRSAIQNVDRDAVLLVSTDKGDTFKATTLDRWKLNACPMTSFAFAHRKGDLQAAWETSNRVRLGTLRKAAWSVQSAPSLNAPAKHPSLAVDEFGNTLLAWTEGTGWNRGGTLAWQVYDAAGRPTLVKGRRDDLPVWDLPTAVATDHGFVLMY